MKITKKKIREFVKIQLGTNPAWAVKAMVRIYDEGQTETEKACGLTKDDNGIGFNGLDSELLSSFSEQVKQRGSLSSKQMGIVFKKMPKYHGQVIDMSDENKLLPMVEKHFTKTQTELKLKFKTNHNGSISSNSYGR